MSWASAIRMLLAEACRKRSTDAERLAGYVAGFIGRHGGEKAPTVRQAARSLGWTELRVKRAVDDVSYGGRLVLYAANEKVPFGDWFVDHHELMEREDARTLRTGGMSP